MTNVLFISAAAMGVQPIFARRLSEPGISTVLLNTTMTNLSVAWMNVLRRREPKLPRPNRLQAIALLAFAVGALMAAFGVSKDPPDHGKTPLQTDQYISTAPLEKFKRA